MKGLKLRGVVGLFTVALAGAGVLVAHVYKQNTYVRQSILSVKLAKEESQLRNEIALLEVEVGSLKKLSRIEGLARGQFGLEYGITPILVYPQGATAADSPKMEIGKVAWRTKGF